MSGDTRARKARRFYLKLRALDIVPYMPADPEAPLLAYHPPHTGELLEEAAPLAEEMLDIVMGGAVRPDAPLFDDDDVALLREVGQVPGGGEDEPS